MGINEDGRAPGGGTSRRTLLSASAVTAGVAVTTPLAAAADAGRRPQPPDRQLRHLLRQVDPGRIEATVRRLAAFGTRHTLSSQTDPVRGIGAARDWIYAQLQSYVPASNGRLSVELQSFVQPPASRIPTPTTITNVVATLRGVANPERV